MPGWFDTLDGFSSLDSAEDLPAADITCLDGQTIHSQAAQSYTPWLPLHETDSAQTICPIGHSDRPDSRQRTSTMNLRGEAKLHAAPLIRDGDWKPIEFLEDDHVELFNLRKDRAEETDRAARLPDQTRALRQKLHAWRQQVGAQMPTRNPDYDPGPR